jgi:hypothetical protein
MTPGPATTGRQANIISSIHDTSCADKNKAAFVKVFRKYTSG